MDNADRYRELKLQARQIERALEEAKARLEELEGILYLETSFTRPVSDKRGRRAELDQTLKRSRPYQEALNRAHELQASHEDVQDLVSAMRFAQRDQMTRALFRTEDVVRKLESTITRFEVAVDKFSEARQSKTAVSR